MSPSGYVVKMYESKFCLEISILSTKEIIFVCNIFSGWDKTDFKNNFCQTEVIFVYKITFVSENIVYWIYFCQRRITFVYKIGRGPPPFQITGVAINQQT